MNRRDFQIGPGAASLLLIAVVLCMGVLGALSLISARGDARLSERSADMARATAQLDAAAEQKLAELDGILAELSGAQGDEEYLAEFAAQMPEGMALDANRVSWVEQAENGRRLSCAAEIAPLGESPRIYWVEHRTYTELDEDEGDQLLFGDDDALLFGGDDAQPAAGGGDVQAFEFD